MFWCGNEVLPYDFEVISGYERAHSLPMKNKTGLHFLFLYISSLCKSVQRLAIDIRHLEATGSLPSRAYISILSRSSQLLHSWALDRAELYNYSWTEGLAHSDLWFTHSLTITTLDALSIPDDLVFFRHPSFNCYGHLDPLTKMSRLIPLLAFIYVVSAGRISNRWSLYTTSRAISRSPRPHTWFWIVVETTDIYPIQVQSEHSLSLGVWTRHHP